MEVGDSVLHNFLRIYQMSRANGTLPDLKDVGIPTLKLMTSPRSIDLPRPPVGNWLWVGVIVAALLLIGCAIWHPSSSTVIRVSKTGRRKEIKCIPTYTGSVVTVAQVILGVILISTAVVSITKNNTVTQRC